MPDYVPSLDEAPNQHELSAQNSIMVQRQNAFLRAFAGCGNAHDASKEAGVSISTYYRWRHDNLHGFLSRLAVAQSAFGDRIEALAWQRVTHPEGSRGGDLLLITLLNANRPEKFRPNVPVSSGDANELLKAIREFRDKQAEASATADAEAGAGVATASEAESWLVKKQGG